MEGGGNNLLAGIVGFVPIIVKGISVLIDLIANKINKKEIEEDEGKVQEEMENQINELQIQKKQYEEFMDNDADLSFLTNRCGREGTLEECYGDLEKLDKIIAFMQKSNESTAAEAGWYYDLTPLIDAREEIFARVQQLQEIEAMKEAQGLGGFLAELISIILAQLLMAPVTMFEIMLDDISAGNDANHYPSH